MHCLTSTFLAIVTLKSLPNMCCADGKLLRNAQWDGGPGVDARQSEEDGKDRSASRQLAKWNVVSQASCGSVPADIPAGDLNIRFNKITFADKQTVALRLGALDFPVCPGTASWLRQSQAVSVTADYDCPECDIPLSELIEAAGGWPSHPSCGDTAFWDDLLHVTAVQELRLTDVDPSSLLKLPTIWADYTVHDVAEAVHDEFPGIHHVALILQLLKEGAKMDRSVLPTHCAIDFVRGVVALADLNTWAVATVSPHNFQVKWAAGRARPEEVAYWIYETPLEELSHVGIPTQLIERIKGMNLTSARSFTAYQEGSPKHPSWPAMHSAASVSSLWLATVLDLTPAQHCETMAVDYAVAYARTVAGVHYPSDNTAGLNLGQEILARKLPVHLAERYGSNPDVVRAKIKSLRIDWNDYLTGPCF